MTVKKKTVNKYNSSNIWDKDSRETRLVLFCFVLYISHFLETNPCRDVRKKMPI